MKKSYLFTLVLAFVLLCLLMIIMASMPAVIKLFDLSKDKTGNIGSAIGGITAPVIGIISSILLYSALTKQIEGNKEQKLKNDLDIIFLLFKQVEDDIAAFWTEETVGPKDNRQLKRYSGIQGIAHFTYHQLEYYAPNDDENSFKDLFQSGQIITIINSLQLVETRIEAMKSSTYPSVQQHLNDRLNEIYEFRLQLQFESIVETIIKIPAFKDRATNIIERYVMLKNPQFRSSTALDR